MATIDDVLSKQKREQETLLAVIDEGSDGTKIKLTPVKDGKCLCDATLEVPRAHVVEVTATDTSLFCSCTGKTYAVVALRFDREHAHFYHRLMWLAARLREALDRPAFVVPEKRPISRGGLGCLGQCGTRADQCLRECRSLGRGREGRICSQSCLLDYDRCSLDCGFFPPMWPV